MLAHLDAVLASLTGGEDDDEVPEYVADELPADLTPVDVADVPLEVGGEEL